MVLKQGGEAVADQVVFKRYELKYFLTQEQKRRVLSAMEPYMAPDAYGRTIIRNLYFDTDSYRLIRHSLEKPVYKEKLRIRSYRRATRESKVFVELKKKYDHVVYKRRVSMTEGEALSWLCGGESCPRDSQITREIDYFMSYYGSLRPAMVLSYEREAYYARDGSGFRVTFDEHILCRDTGLSLETEVSGTELLEPGYVLMEIKCPGAMPLWMSHVLNREGIYRTSFSKYGTAYSRLIFPRQFPKQAKELKSHA